VAESHKIEVRAANREVGKTVPHRDFNYSPDLDYLENDFIVPGPGAQEGIRKCFVNPKKISEKDIIQRVTAFQNQCSGTRSRGSCAFRTKPATDRYRSAELLLRDREVRQGRHPEFNLERTRKKISHVPDPAKVRNLPQPFSLRSGRSTRFAPDHLLPPMRRWLRRHSETEPNDSR